MTTKSDEIFGKVSALHMAQSSYLEYSQYVNRFRLIPHAGDGLLPVYRRVLLAAANYPKLTLTNSIVSDTCRDWHPHGSASVEPVVSNMVRRCLLAGKGNHGARLLERVGAAAPRYTKTSSIKEVSEVLFKLKAYAPHYMNEVNNDEPEFLPTPVPLSLVYGHQGMGVGVVTRIPAFTYASLVKAYREDNPNHLRPQYGYKLEGGELSDLWHHGVGRIHVSMDVSFEWSADDGCMVSVISGSGELFLPQLGMFDEYMEQGRVFIRDESTKNIRIVIGRTKGTRAISDDRIYELALLSANFNRKYDIRVVVGKSVQRIGIRDWLSLTMSMYETQYKRWQDDQTIELRKKIFQQCVSQNVGECLRDQLDDKTILKNLNADLKSGKLDDRFSDEFELMEYKREATAEDVKDISKKSLVNLRNTDYTANIKKLLSQLKEVLSATSTKAIDAAAKVITL